MGKGLDRGRGQGGDPRRSGLRCKDYHEAIAWCSPDAKRGAAAAVWHAWPYAHSAPVRRNEQARARVGGWRLRKQYISGVATVERPESAGVMLRGFVEVGPDSRGEQREYGGAAACRRRRVGSGGTRGGVVVADELSAAPKHPPVSRRQPAAPPALSPLPFTRSP